LRAVELIEEKRKKVKENIIREYKDDNSVKVLRGKYGPYLSIKKKNFKIPKEINPEELTLKDCLKIAEDPKNVPKKRFSKKRK